MHERTKHSDIAGGVVVNTHTGHILVVNQNNDSWSLPKGHVEDGETLLAAAQREITEESGITHIIPQARLGTYERLRIGKGGVGEDASERKTIHIYLFSTDEDTLLPRDLGNPEARWVPRKDVVNLLTHEKDKEFFQGILKDIPPFSP